MSKSNARAQFYMMLGMAGVIAAPVDHTCDPYTKPSYNAANQDLNEVLVRVDAGIADSNLCEVMS